MNREDIERIVFGADEELNASLPDDRRLPAAADTWLRGERGRLDSIELVDPTLSVETKAQEVGGAEITLANEKAPASFRRCARRTDRSTRS